METLDKETFNLGFYKKEIELHDDHIFVSWKLFGKIGFREIPFTSINHFVIDGHDHPFLRIYFKNGKRYKIVTSGHNIPLMKFAKVLSKFGIERKGSLQWLDPKSYIDEI